MPIKRVQFPDGSIHRIEVPEGATNDQIIAFVQAQHPGAQKRQDGLVRQSAENLFGQSGANALDALQHHIGNLGVGIGQGAEHLLNVGVQAMAGGTDYAKGRQQQVNADDAAIRQRETDYQARVPDGLPAAIGATVGEIAPWMVGAGEARAAGLLPTITDTGLRGVAKKAGLLAGEGAVMGAAQPVTEGDYAGTKGRQIAVGAIAAPATAGALRTIGAGAGAARQLADYATDAGRERVAASRLAKIYGDAPETLARLRQASNVPGFQPTPAQALGTPEAVQAERVMRNNGMTAPAFAAQESANNAALRGEVARLAGSDADMAAAATARREGPGAFWRDNLPRGAEDGRYRRAQAHLADYMQSRPIAMPEFKILDEARKIAGQVERGSISQVEGDKAIRQLAPKTRGGQKALDQALGLIDGGMVNPSRVIGSLQTLSRDANPTVAKSANAALDVISRNQDGQGWVHARVLDGLRQNIGAMLRDSAPMGAVGSAEGAAYGPVKAKIVNQIDRAIPGYRDNLAAYARASQPINDMEAARTLLSAIDRGGRDAGGNQNVGLSQVKSLLARDARADYPMSPQAQQRIGNILDALQQRSITNNTIAATGPGTAADTLRGLQSNSFLLRLLGYGASGGGAVVGGLPGFLVGAGATEAANSANNAVLRKVGTKAADAKLTADAIEAARQRARITYDQSALARLIAPLLPYDTRALPPP